LPIFSHGFLFVPAQRQFAKRATIGRGAQSQKNTFIHRQSGASLYANCQITLPTQDEAEQMGIREWPQQAKAKGTFTESSKADKTLTRYILDGKGKVQVDNESPFTVKAGDLVEVTGQATLTWEVTSDEMILLTPGFEQLGLFAGVVLGLVVLLGALTATTGN
jgi:quercetin dioxygenase-like cupin family protein